MNDWLPVLEGADAEVGSIRVAMVGLDQTLPVCASIFRSPARRHDRDPDDGLTAEEAVDAIVNQARREIHRVLKRLNGQLAGIERGDRG